jgi:hypothetical protein
MKRLLLTSVAALLMATSASAQSSGPAGTFFGGLGSGGNFGSYAPRLPAQPTKPVKANGNVNSYGACDSTCQAKCQATWRPGGFPNVKACYTHGQSSTLWEMELLSGARQQIVQEAGGPVRVDCSACRAGWGHGMSVSEEPMRARRQRNLSRHQKIFLQKRLSHKGYPLYAAEPFLGRFLGEGA